jgi:hypothetical protein
MPIDRSDKDERLARIEQGTDVDPQTQSPFIPVGGFDQDVLVACANAIRLRPVSAVGRLLFDHDTSAGLLSGAR